MTPEEKLEAFETLFGEISAGLADVVGTMKTSQESTSEIGSVLADMLALMESRKEGRSLTELADAIKAIRINVAAPVVNVDVSPTPVTIQARPIVQILERVQPGDYELKVNYDNMNRISSALITRVAK